MDFKKSYKLIQGVSLLKEYFEEQNIDFKNNCLNNFENEESSDKILKKKFYSIVKKCDKSDVFDGI